MKDNEQRFEINNNYLDWQKAETKRRKINGEPERKKETIWDELKKLVGIK